ncbi:hypothetical protein GCK72_026268 [Caenorhabditis remanei]|uniref:Uncharacterized protein n=1 Tax=Caenorhabditis remanei TaxID=31234 RepID=A0A6A5G5M5_CAERE|nr:hypothetical protein GCK72_022623 [Caenorhabditis remanei]XP_053580355.1 hypothetical protein GCK72_026268 [Caenorhabditis remanei]KAF1746170.1 hypothetical protein GCK72_022623 [Caenorhabditis remanei]KAF1749799.1 hypothetical protein GCK72_026268 [Caenorhabditis remanei]
MPITRWDNPKAKAPEQDAIKNWSPTTEKTIDDFVKEAAMEPIEKPSFPQKSAYKRKREEKKVESPEEAHKRRVEWLHKRAKESAIPTEEGAVLKPSFIFKDIGPFIVNMCLNCRIFNSTQEPKTVADGMVQMPMALCTVCRAHFNHQRATKFFHFDLPSVKKNYNL